MNNISKSTSAKPVVSRLKFEKTALVSDNRENLLKICPEKRYGVSLYSLYREVPLSSTNITKDDFSNFNFKLGYKNKLNINLWDSDFPLSVYSKPVLQHKTKGHDFFISGSTIQNSVDDSLQFEVN